MIIAVIVNMATYYYCSKFNSGTWKLIAILESENSFGSFLFKVCVLKDCWYIVGRALLLPLQFFFFRSVSLNQNFCYFVTILVLVEEIIHLLCQYTGLYLTFHYFQYWMNNCIWHKELQKDSPFMGMSTFQKIYHKIYNFDI